MKLKKILKACLAKMGESDFVDNEAFTDEEKAELLKKLLSSMTHKYKI